MRRCTNCETTVEDPRATLCPNCGAVLPEAPPPPPSPEPGMQQMQRPPKSPGNQVARALLITVLIIVGIAVLLLLGILLLCGVLGRGLVV